MVWCGVCVCARGAVWCGVVWWVCVHVARCAVRCGMVWGARVCVWACARACARAGARVSMCECPRFPPPPPQVPYFRKASSTFVAAITDHFVPRLFAPNEVITSHNRLRFINRGVATR